jgi:hypothetical protein
MSIIFLLETRAAFFSFNDFSTERWREAFSTKSCGYIIICLVLLAQKSGVNQIIYVLMGGDE